MISNRITLFSATVVLGLAAGTGTAGAANYNLALPESFSGDTKSLETQVWSLFSEGAGQESLQVGSEENRFRDPVPRHRSLRRPMPTGGQGAAVHQAPCHVAER